MWIALSLQVLAPVDDPFAPNSTPTAMVVGYLGSRSVASANESRWILSCLHPDVHEDADHLSLGSVDALGTVHLVWPSGHSVQGHRCHSAVEKLDLDVQRSALDLDIYLIYLLLL